MRLKLVAAFGGRCACCGLVDDEVAYDFHHLDPTEKQFRLSGAIKAWHLLVEEVKKCVMLCAICHRKFHAGMISIPVDAPRFDEALVPNIPRAPHPGRTWSVGSRKGTKHGPVAQRQEQSADNR